jgi:hypothetical protein
MKSFHFFLVALALAVPISATLPSGGEAQTAAKRKAKTTVQKQIGPRTFFNRKLFSLRGCQRIPFPACATVYNNRSDPNPYFWSLDNDCTTTLTYHVDLAGQIDDVDEIESGYRFTWNDSRIRHITWCGY